MGFFNSLWRKLTDTAVLKESSGDYYETPFFASANKVMFIAGLSFSDRGLFYKMYSAAVKFAIAILIFSELSYLLRMPSAMNGIIDNINVVVIFLIGMYRYVNMIQHKDIYKNLALSMESPHFDITTPERKKIFQFWLKNTRKYWKLLLILANCTLMVWFVYPLIDDLEYNLVVPIWVPFEYQTPARYLLTYSVVLVAFNYASYFIIFVHLITQAHLMHLLCQFDVLSDCFKNILSDCCEDFEDLNQNLLLLNESFRQRYTERLRYLVEQHKFLLNNTQELRRVLSAPMLGQLAASGMLICCIAYQVSTAIADSMAKFFMSLLYLGYNMFELFLFCRWCDEIKMQTEQIRDAVYSSGWECGVVSLPDVRVRLMLVMARANQPIVLTAGGLYDLSLNSYAILVKASYSALTVLLRVRHD